MNKETQSKPFLRVPDPLKTYAWLIDAINPKIPLRVVRLDKITVIAQEIKREFSAPSGIGDIPLLRAPQLYRDTCCVIIITPTI
jgi:hypothetical protein